MAYDNLSRGNAEAVDGVPLEVGDLADRARLREVVARHRPHGHRAFCCVRLYRRIERKTGRLLRQRCSAAPRHCSE